MRTHEIIGSYAGTTKTWGEVQRLYYGINKAEVAWVVRNCELCCRNRPSKVAPPAQMIRPPMSTSFGVLIWWICEHGNTDHLRGATTPRSIKLTYRELAHPNNFHYK